MTSSDVRNIASTTDDEPDVRGYWRKKSNGERVWVRPHNRGRGDMAREKPGESK